MTRWWWSVVAVVMPVVCAAHGLDPAALTLEERTPGVYDVTWQVAALRLPGANVQPKLPPTCTRTTDGTVREDDEHVTLAWQVTCAPSTLDDATIAVDDLPAAKINVLLRIARLGADDVLTVLSARRPSFVVPRRPDRLTIVHEYGQLGWEHILGGADHLLFVFGLLLLVPTTRALVQTITAFTAGHSVTLSLAALGLAEVPSRPTEVVIAISILVLAVELARDPAVVATSWLRRAPWAMAAAFGLLHGLGFAGALAETGLPPEHALWALVAFNVGIEFGQLVFVGVVLTARRVLPVLPPRPAVYVMGILAAFWCYERLAAWLG